MLKATIYRMYTPFGTWGQWYFNDASQIFMWTLENPWKDNEANVSCIPEGDYRVTRRDSPLIKRLTDGAYTKAWHIENVPNRTFIEIHIGNDVSNTDGCVLTGSKPGIVKNGLWVSESRKAFDRFMQHLDGVDKFILSIKQAPSPASSLHP